MKKQDEKASKKKAQFALNVGNWSRPDLDWEGQKTDRLVSFVMQSMREVPGQAMGKALEELARRGWAMEQISPWLAQKERDGAELASIVAQADPAAFERLLLAGALPWEQSGLGERFDRLMKNAPIALREMGGLGALLGAALFEAGRPDGAEMPVEPFRLGALLLKGRPSEGKRALQGSIAALEALARVWGRRSQEPKQGRLRSARRVAQEAFGPQESWPEPLGAAWSAWLDAARQARELGEAARPALLEFACAMVEEAPWREALGRLSSMGALGASLAQPSSPDEVVDSMTPLGLAIGARNWDAALEAARLGAPWGQSEFGQAGLPFDALGHALSGGEGPPDGFWSRLGPALGAGERVERLARMGLLQTLSLAKTRNRARAALSALELGLEAAEPSKNKEGPRL